MKTNLEIFCERGTGYQYKLSQLALQACYLSSQYGVPFLAQSLIAGDEIDYDYLDGYLHGICLGQNNKIVCSLYVDVTPFVKTIEWYLCTSYTDDLTIALSIPKSLKDNFAILHRSYTPDKSSFSFVDTHHLEAMNTLNEDIFLYSILYAYRIGVRCVPQKIISSSTDKYSMVRAWGLIEGLRKVLGERFNCTLNQRDGTIEAYNIDETYFKEYTREKLIEKYVLKNYMDIKALFESFEKQIDDLKIKVTISRS